MAVDVFRQHAVGVQLGQQVAAFILRQADDTGGEALADEQRLAAVFRVGAHNRVYHFRHLSELLGREGRAPIAFEFGFAVACGVGVRGAAAFDRLAQGLGQVVPGFMHVGEQCVATLGRQLLGMEHRAQARQLLIGEVRVPELAGVSQADGLAVFDDVGDDQDFRVVGQQELFEHMDLQHAETAAEGDLLLGGDTLVAEDHDVMVQMRAVNACEVLVADRAGQVQAYDFGADAAGKWTDLEGLCGVGRCWNSRGGRHEFTPVQSGE
eukprot:gene21699-biopygen22005